MTEKIQLGNFKWHMKMLKRAVLGGLLLGSAWYLQTRMKLLLKNGKKKKKRK